MYIYDNATKNIMCNTYNNESSNSNNAVYPVKESLESLRSSRKPLGTATSSALVAAKQATATRCCRARWKKHLPRPASQNLMGSLHALLSLNHKNEFQLQISCSRPPKVSGSAFEDDVNTRRNSRVQTRRLHPGYRKAEQVHCSSLRS